MRTNFTVEDVKNLLDDIFNGNLWQSKYSKGQVAYENPNSEKILLTNEDTLESEQVDLAEYLNIKFYTWKERVVEKSNDGYGNSSLSTFEDWVLSLNMSMNEAYALVEKIDEEIVTSQDIDSASVTAKVTLLVQADKIKNLDYYLTKLRNAYVGNPQDYQNTYGDKLKMYILLGALLYEQEPMTLQYGECMVVSFNLKINYLNDALSYSDIEVSLSLDGDDTYDENGEIVGETKYLTMPITKATMQRVFTSTPVPTAVRPDMTGFVNSTLSNGETLTFYDFNKELTNAFNDLFWRCGAYRVDGILSAVQDVNIPVFIRVKTATHTYVYKDVIVSMEKVLQNNDFNISSVTLKGWGKIAQE